MTKRKDGRWQEVVRTNGKTRYFYGATKAEVLRKIQGYREQEEKGALFYCVAEEWWEQHEPTLSPNSIRSYKPCLNRAVLHFCDRPIKDITPVQIASYLGEFATNGYAQKTANTQLLVFSLIFKYAVMKGYVLFNPARDLSVPKNLAKSKRHTIPQNEIELVRANTDKEMGLLAYMAMYTGLRKGELLALTWDDIDMDKRTISVTKSVYFTPNTPHIKKPKTDTSIGTVPILDALIPFLHPSTGIVFKNKKGTYYTAKEFENAWKKYQRDTGITSTLHQFRHAYATMLFEANVPPEKMQVLLRHAQLSTTMDVYKELRDDKLKSIHQEVYSVDFVSKLP